MHGSTVFKHCTIFALCGTPCLAHATAVLLEPKPLNKTSLAAVEVVELQQPPAPSPIPVTQNALLQFGRAIITPGRRCGRRRVLVELRGWKHRCQQQEGRRGDHQGDVRFIRCRISHVIPRILTGKQSERQVTSLQGDPVPQHGDAARLAHGDGEWQAEAAAPGLPAAQGDADGARGAVPPDDA